MVKRLQELLTGRPVGVWILLAGMLMTLGFAPFFLWPVGLASLVFLWVLTRTAASWWQAWGAALVWGMGHQVTALYWLPWAFYKDSDGSWLAAIGGGVPALLGLAVYGCLTYVVAASVAYSLRFWPVMAAAGWVLAWVGMEVVKSLSPLGFPWLPVGGIWGGSGVLMQGASVASVFGLSGLILLLVVLLGHGTRTSWLMAAGLLTVVGVGGGVRLSAPAAAPALPNTAQVVRMVQPNITSNHKWDAVKRWEILQQTLDVGLSGGAVPPTVVMPETAVAFYLDEEVGVRQAVAVRLGQTMPADGALVTGTVRREADMMAPTGRKYYNSIGVMGADGTLYEAYDKQLLVPFGEYIPVRGILEAVLPVPLKVISQSRLDYTHGTADPRISTPAGIALGLICYEGIFPLHVARHARGARYLVNVTNDNWFTGTTALAQHLALERLRAVETGLPLVRVANTGISAVYDGYGREVLRLPVGVATYGDFTLPETVATVWRWAWSR